MSWESDNRFDRKIKGGMAIVLIEWSIKPDRDSVTEFMQWWREEAVISDKSGLTGEFLSAPVPTAELSLSVDVDDLGTSDGDAPAWTSSTLDSGKITRLFVSKVGAYMKGGLESFEVSERRCVVLEPQEWRLGEWPVMPPTTAYAARKW